MKSIANTFLKGFLFVLPPVITFSVILWVFSSAEAALKTPLLALLPEGCYITGMGVASAIILIFCIGLLVQAYVLGQVFRWLEQQIERIPVVKGLYASARDLLFFMAGDKGADLQKVVAVSFDGEVRLIGFVTAEQVKLGSAPNLLAVYLPLSYAIGGYVVYVPRSRCEFLAISPQQAMQMILTANIQRPPSH